MVVNEVQIGGPGERMSAQAFDEAFVLPDFGVGIPEGGQNHREGPIDYNFAGSKEIKLRLQKRKSPE